MTNMIRKPEYTGKNRCFLCTIVNLVIAIILSGIMVAAVSRFVHGLLPLIAGIGTLLGLFGVVYLRGYLIPGTPRLTERYLPGRLLSVFEKQTLSDIEHPETATESIDIESILWESKAIESRGDQGDDRLSPEFRDAWTKRIREIRRAHAERNELALLLGVKKSRITFVNRPRRFSVEVDDEQVGEWPSHAALLADIAASPVLAEWSNDWGDLGVDQRGHALHILRIFLDTCPICDGPVTINEGTIKSCCRSIEVVEATCQNCSERIFELPQSLLEG